MKTGRPNRDEAEGFFWNYIDLAEGDDPVAAMERQLGEAMKLFAEVTEERSLFRYAAGKWSIRQAQNHVNDMERVFAYRALWFGRGFASGLESFDENAGAVAGASDRVGWAALVDEFRVLRLGTIALFRNMPEEGWVRRGKASGNMISVRALAFLTVGHAAHHLAILRERYLAKGSAFAQAL